MNHSDKLLTVIVPSYNMEEYLPKCLGSLIVPDQDMLERLDIIVVNDGSKDRTSEIAHDFERRYPGVFRVIDKPNGNYGSCINAALPMAAGFYVKILDADDSVDSAIFWLFLKALLDDSRSREGTSDIVVTDFSIVDDQGAVKERICQNWHPWNSEHSLGNIPKNAPRFALHGVTYRTEMIRSMGYRQTEGISYTDIEWVIEPIVAVRRISYVPLPVVKYLVGRTGQTVQLDTFIRKYQDHFLIAENLVSRYETRASQCNSDSLSAYNNWLVQFLVQLYSTKIYGFPKFHGLLRCRVEGDLRALDEHIRQHPSLFLETEYALSGHRWPFFRLIHAWRHHPGTGTAKLLAFGVFIRVKSIALCLRALLRRILGSTSTRDANSI